MTASSCTFNSLSFYVTTAYSVENCAQLCVLTRISSDAVCYAFEFNSSNGNCFFKNVKNGVGIPSNSSLTIG